MPAKAVYNSQTLAVYITRHELELILQTGRLSLYLQLGKTVLEDAYVHLELDPATIEAIQFCLNSERNAIERIKGYEVDPEHLKYHPAAVPDDIPF